jgi:3-oxoacyl-[acyl-carrier-protein] synthase II
MRRVVVTGLGMVCPLGVGVGHVWRRLVNAESGIGSIQSFATEDLSCKIAGQIPAGRAADGAFDPDEWVEPKDQKKMDRFIVCAIAAAAEAVKNSGWVPPSEEARERTGVMIGSGIGGLPGICETSITLHERGPRRVSPFFIASNLINLASGQVSIRFGFRGPNHAVVTACASGAHAIGDAARMIALDDADVMVAGGAEATVCRIGIAGFAASKALSTHFNDTPARASRPWDVDRDGFVMGEGSGVLILEELEHAKRRGAHIHAEIKPEDIDYVNAHGTSTPLGDEIEVNAVKRLYGDHAYKLGMSSTKSAIGHLLGAAGAVEAIFCIKAIETGLMPPTLNLDNPSPGCDIDLIPHRAKERKVRNVMSNSFGFGGTNASLVITAAP